MSDDNEAEKVTVPIRLADTYAYDPYDAADAEDVKESFKAEMMRVDEEMKKFSRELFHMDSHSLSAQNTSNDVSLGGSWRTIDDCPLVEISGETKVLKLQFDVSEYEPEELVINVEKDKLVISAAHEELLGDNKITREFHREVPLPKGTDAAAVISDLYKDGVLMVQAPLTMSHEDLGPALEGT